MAADRMSGDESIWQAVAYLSDLNFIFPKKITRISAVPRHLFIQTACSSLPAFAEQAGLPGSFPEAGVAGGSLPASPWESFSSSSAVKENKGHGCCNPPWAREILGQLRPVLRTQAHAGRWEGEGRK